MTDRPGSSFASSPRARLMLVFAIAVAAAGLAFLYAAIPVVRDSFSEDEVSNAFEELLVETRGVAAQALESSGSPNTTTIGVHRFGRRLEGVGIVNEDLAFISWEGTPSEPSPGFADPAQPDWGVHLDGTTIRLIARAGPDAEGHWALATFTLSSKVGGLAVHDLLPSLSRFPGRIEFRFRDTRAGSPQPDFSDPTDPRLSSFDPPPIHVDLGTPAGESLGVAMLYRVDDTRRFARARAFARSWGIAVFLVALTLAFDWRRISRSRAGLPIAMTALVAGRLMLLFGDVPATLLSRAWSGPGAFGSAALWGLLSSPADLFLTAITCSLVAHATALHTRGLEVDSPRLAAGLAWLFAVAASISAMALTVPLVRDSRFSLLDGHAPFSGDARALLLASLGLVILGAASLWGVALAPQRMNRGRSPRAMAIVATLLLSAACGAWMTRQERDLALDRLRSEYAPLVLEQRSRRKIALVETMQRISDAYGPDRVGQNDSGLRLEYLAYEAWIDSELFHAGYLSSLDFYNVNGDRLNGFSFGLPHRNETVDPENTVSDQLLLYEETTDLVLSRQQQVLHAEISVFRDGERLGTVVGHVIDEPDNLPFLPTSQPYLAALGAGAVGRGAEDPDYVLYDALGTVLVSTLPSPPPQTEQLRQAAATGQIVEVGAANDRFVGLPLPDNGRLHLLLFPRLSLLDQVAAAVRMAILSAVLFVVIGLAPRLWRRRGLAKLIRRLRQSFYRKLLAAMLVASVVPLVGLGLFLRGYVERRGNEALSDAAIQAVNTAQRVLDEYLATQEDSTGESADRSARLREVLDDDMLYWVRRLVGQPTHVYANGVLLASSTRELFDSGLLPRRLDGTVRRGLTLEGRPNLVIDTPIGPTRLPVAYAPLREPDPHLELIVSVPVVLEQRRIDRAVDRLGEVILLSTVLLVGMLALAGAWLARAVARPVRELVAATGRISAGDYDARLQPKTEDEVAELVHGFNSMAAALATQRSDLEQRREYMERLLRYATTGVISTDTEGRIVTLNPAARDLLAEAGETLEMGRDLIETLSASRGLHPLADALREPGSLGGKPVDVELGGGQARRLRFVRVTLRDPAGGLSGSLILVDDVTDLMRSNQLAAWAEMARAIAHEIKNPLTPIQLSTEHLRRILEDRGLLPSPEIESCLDSVIKQVRSLREIAGEFSTFSQYPTLVHEDEDPVALMREIIAPYLAAPPPGLTIVEEFATDVPLISADRRLLGRALINLVENALQAMPDGGRLTVSVEATTGPDEVSLSIADTGTGLDADVHRRLFEPYFSTKSSGTGLGLAIVRRTIEAHHGRIEVDSEPERGTTFRLFLPSVRSSRNPDLV